jgi:hypothetical protein
MDYKRKLKNINIVVKLLGYKIYKIYKYLKNHGDTLTKKL